MKRFLCGWATLAVLLMAAGQARSGYMYWTDVNGFLLGIVACALLYRRRVRPLTSLRAQRTSLRRESPYELGRAVPSVAEGLESRVLLSTYAVYGPPAVTVPAATLPTTYLPINLTPQSYTQDMVVEAGAVNDPTTHYLSNITASMDGGLTKVGDTWYERGLNTAAPTTGLPPAGTVLLAQDDPGTAFVLQPYTGNNAAMLDVQHPTATLTLAAPAGYSSLRFITSSGNGKGQIGVTIHFGHGAPDAIGSFSSPDWFQNMPIAFTANGRVAASRASLDNVNSNNPRLLMETVPVADIADPIASIDLKWTGQSQNTHTAIFALSGSGMSPVGTQAAHLTLGDVSGIYGAGGGITLTATLIDAASPAMSLSGQLVQFGIAGQFVGGAITDASGKATLNSPLPIGVPTGQLANGVIASFAGDATYAPVNARGNLSVSPADTAIAVDNVFGAFPQAGSVTLTAHVTARSPSTATVNEGTVKFNLLDARNKSVGAASDVPVSNGTAQASFSLAGLPPGNYSIQASYSDSAVPANFNPGSAATPGTLALRYAPTALTLGQFGTNDTGSGPNSPLVLDGSGNLYGTTSSGGATGHGTIFEIDHATGAIITLASAATAEGFGTGLVRDSSGNLYGTTPSYTDSNGYYVNGTVFELSKGTGSSWTLSTVASFDAQPGLVLDGAGNLYGTTLGGENDYGTVFELSRGSGPGWTLGTLVSFSFRAAFSNGAYPIGGLIADASGNLYGITSGGGANKTGTIFELSRAGGSSWRLSTLASFDSNEVVSPGLALDANGNLYGAAEVDVNGNAGTIVFELSKASESSWMLNTIASLDPTGGVPGGPLVVDASGNLYGTNYNGVFELSKGGGSNWTLGTIAPFDGSVGYAQGGLTLDAAGNLYGTITEYGQTSGGTIFGLSKRSGSSWTLSTVASFSVPVDAFHGSLVRDGDGNLYGTTEHGHDNSIGFVYRGGTVFELARGSQSPTALVSFGGGSFVGPDLVLDASGNLYGTVQTLDVNYNFVNTVFELPKGRGSIQTLATLPYFDPSQLPSPSLVTDANGNLFGTTASLDDNGNRVDTVFELSKSGGSNWTLANLATFNWTGGNLLVSGLLVDASGNLYGTMSTAAGDTVFELSRGSGTGWTLTTIVSAGPISAMDANGNLYGTTSTVDASDKPVYTIFELSRQRGSSWTFSTLASSPNPFSDLVVDAGGNLYGGTLTVDTNCNQFGAVFELSKGIGPDWTLGTVASFPPSEPGSFANPPGGLFVDPAGNLYGFTFGDGVAGAGTIFELLAQPSQITGTVWADANHNGTLDSGETGLAGVTVFLDLNRDGKLDPGDPTVTTDASGNYTFTGLHPGTYTVRQVLPDGYAATAPRGYSATINLGAGQNAAGPNFGDVRISSVTLGFDYLLLIARNYGQAGSFADGDLNGDGRVDFDDLVLLARNYGRPLR